MQTDPVDASPAREVQGLRALRYIAFFTVLIPVCVAFVFIMLQVSHANPPSAGQVGLNFAKSTMQWTSGPNLQGVYPTTVGNLGQTLLAHVPGRTAQDVNVRQLIQKFGRKPRIDVVALSGIFNSLAPDEGITGPGTVVVLVDAVTRRVFDNFILD